LNRRRPSNQTTTVVKVKTPQQNMDTPRQSCNLDQFSTNLFRIYNEMCGALQKADPIQQPIGLLLFWIEEYLRFIAGIWKGHECFTGTCEDAMSVSQIDEMKRSNSFYMVQQLSQSMPPALVQELFQALDMTMSEVFEVSNEPSTVLSLLRINVPILLASTVTCTSCPVPSSCRMRGAPFHASVPLVMAIHLRVIQHFRLLVEPPSFIEHTHQTSFNPFLATSPSSSSTSSSSSSTSLPRANQSGGDQEQDRIAAMFLLSMIGKY
jgi:hypothetical protein